MIKKIKAKLIKKTKLTSDVLFLKFNFVSPKMIDFNAGQYLILEIGKQRRSYSISSPDHQKKSFELIVKLVEGGIGSTYFKNLKIGKVSHFLGPVGFFTLNSLEKNKIFFAGGTGIAPIRSQLLSLFPIIKPYQRIILFWGLKTKKDVYLLKELKKNSQKFPNFQFKICLDQETDFSDLDKNYFFEGRVQKAFEDFAKEKKLHLNDFEYYLCGPPLMIEALKEFLSQQGIKKEKIFFEKF